MQNKDRYDNKLRKLGSYGSNKITERLSRRRDKGKSKIKPPVMSICVSSAQYAAFELASKTSGGVLLHIVNAGNIKKRARGNPFLGNIVIVMD